ncbi:MAG: DNA/RNA nuclease SfsA [Planctomycetes bacterium]|nr:DNA/RNA nuclease SfsA [Planctomycetota bacterium]
MHFPRPLVKGTLIKRYKRFFVDVELDAGGVVTAHCTNTGSLKGCLAPGLPVYLLDSENPERKLRYTWYLIKAGRAFINIETGVPNRVVHESAVSGRIPELKGYAIARREVPYGVNSRIDLLLEGRDGDPRPCYVEVKCTTLAEGELAMFPDAVTERGLKHLVELQKMVKKGARAVQFFFCSRTDICKFRPADAIDPAYGKELRKAARSGVEVMAWRAKITTKSIELDAPVPVDLS